MLSQSMRTATRAESVTVASGDRRSGPARRSRGTPRHDPRPPRDHSRRRDAERLPACCREGLRCGSTAVGDVAMPALPELLAPRTPNLRTAGDLDAPLAGQLVHQVA